MEIVDFQKSPTESPVASYVPSWSGDPAKLFICHQSFGSELTIRVVVSFNVLMDPNNQLVTSKTWNQALIRVMPHCFRAAATCPAQLLQVFCPEPPITTAWSFVGRHKSVRLWDGCNGPNVASQQKQLQIISLRRKFYFIWRNPCALIGSVRPREFRGNLQLLVSINSIPEVRADESFLFNVSLISLFTRAWSAYLSAICIIAESIHW